MRPQRMAPDAAIMVLEAKVPAKLYAAASVNHPMATVQHANGTLLVRCWKHITGTSRLAHTEALSGPWKDGCLGLRRSEHSWQVAVT